MWFKGFPDRCMIKIKPLAFLGAHECFLDKVPVNRYKRKRFKIQSWLFFCVPADRSLDEDKIFNTDSI